MSTCWVYFLQRSMNFLLRLYFLNPESKSPPPLTEGPPTLYLLYLYKQHSAVCLLRHTVLHCGRVPAANAPGCTAAEGLFYKPCSLVVPTCTRDPSSERRNYLGEKWPMNFAWNARLPHIRDILRAVNLRHGTNGFTFFPKEGVLRIFTSWKFRRLRPGLNPRTWVPKASTQPLDHRSRLATRCMNSHPG